MNTIINTILEGKIRGLHRNDGVTDLPWNDHPTFEGVSLKHLVTGSETEKMFSCHLVRIGAGCSIGRHTHDTAWELHEVISGVGEARLDEESLHYAPGNVTVLPAGVSHEVYACETEDLYILAKFIPALL